jgi:hypothetical protein
VGVYEKNYRLYLQHLFGVSRYVHSLSYPDLRQWVVLKALF